jgi:RNA polymerase sigma-70 factor (sigma-E family)
MCVAGNPLGPFGCSCVESVSSERSAPVDPDAAFAELVAVRSTALLRTAFLLAGSRGDAEDLLQEALFATYRSRHRVRDLEALEGYVRTTMVRLLLRWRRRRWTSEIPFGELPDVGAVEGETPSCGEAWPLIQRLPVRQRAVIVLAYYEDLPELRIAELLGCSTGAVKSHRARALAALRRDLVVPEAVGGGELV